MKCKTVKEIVKEELKPIIKRLKETEAWINDKKNQEALRNSGDCPYCSEPKRMGEDFTERAISL